MADEPIESAEGTPEVLSLGKSKQKTKFYTADEVAKLIAGAIKKETATRDAAIRAAIDKFNTGTLDTKLAGLEFKLTDDTGSTKSGINYQGGLDSLSQLDDITDAKHGDMYIIHGTGYVYTVTARVDTTTQETVYDKYWVPLNAVIDLSNYFTKDETWSKAKLESVEKLVQRNNAMILAIVAQLNNLADKEGLGSGASNSALAELQASILAVLQACHNDASRILDEELGEGDFEPQGE